MTPSKPYLIRGFYDWIVDNECTPYIAVDTDYPNVMVPHQFINDGQIVLNIAPQSVGGLSLTGDVLEFNARFGGKLEHLYVPFEAIIAIYARENGEGSSFAVNYPPMEDITELSEAPQADVEASSEDVKEDSKKPKKGRPSLSIVK